ncbi:MAG: N-acyl-L-amino acid amidohydrolase [Bacteroidetes bacterium GWF2_33_16]|nr:MAG: N-acyl-L-amino acid amidohydrolase [Bacteroidetes bacterium GWE2_32_14]OFY02346.1 MAG: N-acyl-L-amino acid amidohydrolase [Bacteroidetes bacterium GWF2_33_16]
MDIKEKIKNLSEKYYSNVVKIRQHIHKHPELSFNEHHTANYVASILETLDLKFNTGIAGTGITGIIEGKNPGKKCVALRADMDALPIEEKNDISYKSVNKGVMHACGHDAHTASLLGAIMILNDLKDEFEGTVKFIFQPAEEKIPGGAKLMVEEGVLKNPTPSVILAQHAYPELVAGKIGIRAGTYMASSDEIYITVKGKGGHAAIPDKIDNTVLIASKLVVNLQQIPKSIAPKDTPTVLSIGKMIAQGATNVIPDEVYMEGTFRTMNEEWRANAHSEIHKMAKELADQNKVEIEVKILTGYPVLSNHIESTEKAKNIAIDFVGADNVIDLEPRMTSEDFAYYSQEIPAVFYRLGITKPGSDLFFPLHSPNFTIHDEAMKTGIALFAYQATQFLID